MPIKHWEIVDKNTNDINNTSLLQKVIKARGGGAQTALTENTLSDFPQLIDMDKAVVRVRRAIELDEPIAVYGDYDCDGITSTALLYSYLESEGADVSYYIPDRHTEGYGMNKAAIKSLHENGIKLIITVDNGISAVEEVEYASSLGMDIVITDHHRPGKTIPNAVAVVNPHRTDCPSTLTNLCGVGVAFALIVALEEGDEELILDQYADIVAIGTVADVVALSGVNRTFVKRGQKLMAEHPRAGISALIEVSGADAENITAETIAYSLVPRINAAGRIGDVEAALLLLLTSFSEQAEAAANELNNYNNKRREIEAKIIEDIATKIKENPDLIKPRIMVISGDNWHHGVVGIVAAKLSEKYSKPCILLCADGDCYRGSGRSVEGFSLIEAIFDAKEMLLRYGGHNMAAGLTIKAEEAKKFTAHINAYAAEKYPIMPTGKINIDAEISPEMLSIAQIKELDTLAPYGEGNPTPIFCIKGAKIMEIKPLSGGKHIKLKLKAGGFEFFSLYFGMSDENFPYHIGAEVDIVFTVSINKYAGNESVSLKTVDIRKAGINQGEILKQKGLYSRYCMEEDISDYHSEITPSREDAAVIYRKIKELSSYNLSREDMYLSENVNVSYCKYLIAIDALSELGLIEISPQIKIATTSEKKDFSSAKCILKLANISR